MASGSLPDGPWPIGGLDPTTLAVKACPDIVTGLVVLPLVSVYLFVTLGNPPCYGNLLDTLPCNNRVVWLVRVHSEKETAGC